MSCRQDTLGRPRGRPAYRVPGQAARHLRDTLMEADVSPPTRCRYACLLAHLIKLPNHAAGGINIDLKINPRCLFTLVQSEIENITSQNKPKGSEVLAPARILKSRLYYLIRQSFTFPSSSPVRHLNGFTPSLAPSSHPYHTPTLLTGVTSVGEEPGGSWLWPLAPRTKNSAGRRAPLLRSLNKIHIFRPSCFAATASGQGREREKKS
ncbi:hypothetical protein C0Q70_12902 [Pomacea canaliculata]|uniref:Uncharacterized protein n=1 Tax=Pomacea canaliculata TaxID=400727 RepID=A0A2T7P2U6_POMCA|nr:hypothetical protein C0Q70_12902 [Pomacea canaliculata]